MFLRAAVALIALTLNALATSSTPLPLLFERNTGQADARSQYLARGQGYEIQLQPGAISLVRGQNTVCMRLDGANPAPRIVGRELQEGKANYLIGNREMWRTGIPLYRMVEYQEVYPGINLVLYGNGRELEYDFSLAPGARVGQIKVSFEGVERLSIEGGDLVLKTASGEIRHRKPRIYQRRNGRKVEAAGRFVLRSPRQAGFVVDAYDRKQELVIDPTLAFGTYMGGSGDDRAWAVAVDEAGCAYLVGETWSANFPGTFNFSHSTGNQDAYIVKMNASGTAVVYATYFGGQGRDSARGVAVDSAGNAYIAGFSTSADFPTTGGAYRTSPAGLEDAFVVKLNASGSGLLYSTLLGGGGSDFATGIAVDSAGNAYISGYTSSLAFPVTSGAFQRDFKGGGQDAFVAKLNASGSGLIYATYLGGRGNDIANGIAVDPLGFAFVAGYTDSPDFPVRNALNPTPGGQGDGFVAKLNPAGDGLSYATYLGGRQLDSATAVAADASGNAYITGYTSSADFPVTVGAFQTSNSGSFDTFVAKLTTAGSVLAYSTYLGGEGSEQASSIAIDAQGTAYVAGYTDSLRFPLVSQVSAAKGGRDAFAAAVSANGGALIWSTYLGGAAEDRATSIAVDPAGGIYVAGYTYSTDFPTTSAAYRTAGAGGEAFLVKLSTASRPPAIVGVTPASGTGSNTTLVLQYSDPDGAADLTWARTWIGSTSNNSCSVTYHQPSNTISLLNDANTAWVGPLTPGAGSIQNSQCILNGSGSSVSVSGNVLTLTLSISFRAGFSGSQPVSMSAEDRVGLSSGWQARGTWTVSAANSAPSTVSVTPASGSGLNTILVSRYSDPDGAADLTWARVWIGSTLNNACYLTYHQPSNTISLLNDTDTAWAGPLTPGGGSIQNGQCIVNGAGTSVSTSGNVLTLTLSISFRAGSSGSLPVSMSADDRAGLSTGWQTRGTWTTSTVNIPPAAVSVAPASGSGLNTSLTFQYSDANGATDIIWARVWIGSTLNNSCYLVYYQPSNTISLLNDANTAWLGPLTPGRGSIQNSQCILNGGGTSVSASSNVLTLTLSITFRAGFSGSLPVAMSADDRAGLTSGWQTRGTWTTSTVNSPPATISFAPGSGSGLSRTLAFQYSDPDGAADLTWARVWIGSTLNNACYLAYHQPSNTISLLNDTNTAWAGPLSTPGGGSIQNGQCIVNGAGTSRSATGNVLTLTLSLTFPAGFSGLQPVSMSADDQAGLSTGWVARGTWVVP